MRPLKSSGNLELIKRLILKMQEGGGSLSFSEFMQGCLYEEGLGYYATGGGRIGRRGDFYTSVSVGALFGELMARQFCEVDELLGHLGEFVICEQGGHDGTFAVDVLTWFREHREGVLERLKYRFIEPHARLVELQRRNLERAGMMEHAGWYSIHEAMPEMEGVFFSNELVDAFPVDLVVWREGAWRERRICWKGEEFGWCEEPVGERLYDAVKDLPNAFEGYRMEVNLAAERWMGNVARRIRRGVVLTIDYGYRRPVGVPLPAERVDGTLACYRKHARSDDPLREVGCQDITAHVDFERLIAIGERTGLRTEGFTDQHHALVGLAEGDFLREGEPPAPEKLRAFKQLMHPELMGTSFQVLVQSKNLPGLKLSCLKYSRR